MAQSAGLEPYSASNTLAEYLDDRRKTFSGTGFIFDYHLMWDHMSNPGYMDISRTLFSDMKDLDLLGHDGMISCIEI